MLAKGVRYYTRKVTFTSRHTLIGKLGFELVSYQCVYLFDLILCIVWQNFSYLPYKGIPTARAR